MKITELCQVEQGMEGLGDAFIFGPPANCEWAHSGPAALASGL